MLVACFGFENGQRHFCFQVFEKPEEILLWYAEFEIAVPVETNEFDVDERDRREVVEMFDFFAAESCRRRMTTALRARDAIVFRTNLPWQGDPCDTETASDH